jgi:cold shock CspA family protein
MRGEVLHYDNAQGFGFINGADGNRYTFGRGDLRRLVAVTKGTPVEFEVDGTNAREIFVVNGARSAIASQFSRDAVAGERVSTGLWRYFTRSLMASYANFHGRARRKEYWGYLLFYIIAATAIGTVALFLDGAAGNLDGGETPVVTLGLCGLFVLATFIPSLAITIRRIHDIGLSG